MAGSDVDMGEFRALFAAVAAVAAAAAAAAAASRASEADPDTASSPRPDPRRVDWMRRCRSWGSTEVGVVACDRGSLALATDGERER